MSEEENVGTICVLKVHLGLGWKAGEEGILQKNCTDILSTFFLFYAKLLLNYSVISISKP